MLRDLVCGVAGEGPIIMDKPALQPMTVKSAPRPSKLKLSLANLDRLPAKSNVLEAPSLNIHA